MAYAADLSTVLGVSLDIFFPLLGFWFVNETNSYLRCSENLLKNSTKTIVTMTYILRSMKEKQENLSKINLLYNLAKAVCKIWKIKRKKMVP